MLSVCVWYVEGGENAIHMKPEHRNDELGNCLFSEYYLALEPLLWILKGLRRMHYFVSSGG